MKFDHRGNNVYFHVGNAFGLFWSTLQRIYLANRRDEVETFGKVGHLAASESMSMYDLDT